MKRNKDYDAREVALQDMGEKRKDRVQADDESTKESRLPLLIFSGALIIVLCAVVAFKVLI